MARRWKVCLRGAVLKAREPVWRKRRPAREDIVVVPINRAPWDVAGYEKQSSTMLVESCGGRYLTDGREVEEWVSVVVP